MAETVTSAVGSVRVELQGQAVIHMVKCVLARAQPQRN